MGEKRTLTGAVSFSWKLYYMYDENGEVIGFTYKSGNNAEEEYYYLKNLQGDVVAIYDVNGVKQVGYVYDAWGNIISITGTLASTIGNINPFRYRSYYYDSETGFYYLQSRYYDPTVGRFLNANSVFDGNSGIFGANFFTFCANNPINSCDHDGRDAIWLQDADLLPVVGHTGLLIQDSNGKWYHFYWGNGQNGKSGKSNVKGVLKELKDYEYEGLNHLNEKLETLYPGKYEGLIYFHGNFSPSKSYAEKILKNYNLVYDNCMQVSIDILLQGKFSLSDSSYKSFLSKLRRKSMVPNLAYSSLLTFHSVVTLWNRTPWYFRFLVMSPTAAEILILRRSML